ncbi:hypothetical protein [Desulfobulbus alkaliphilus]|uniref:hypothetical protein n=1 Tax=Desulfobulbus alkaliphilus TaxID=869814 RepID=UPI0019630E72|nr:hypothetical protein [Desulfobulbus alkaliphilus]MBM9537471.1 hypothetical protein [Desulfobulbus alkaliphilus]
MTDAKINKIVVADCIFIGNLFQEDGYDEEQSADNLADRKWQIINDYLESTYPDTEIIADIAIQREAGRPRPLEVAAFAGDEISVPSAAAEIQEQLSKKIAEGTKDYSWAVKK